METVQLTGENSYDTQMVMNTATRTSDFSLSREFQKHLSSAAQKHGVIDQRKYKKWASKLNWTEREYHVQNDSDVSQKILICFVIQTMFHHFHVVVHTQNNMVSES